MYSTNTNNQQDRGRQAPNVKPAPRGGHYIIHIEDVITDTGKHGLSIYNETLREADHETPASRVDTGKLERCFLPRFTDMERRARRHD